MSKVWNGFEKSEDSSLRKRWGKSGLRTVIIIHKGLRSHWCRTAHSASSAFYYQNLKRDDLYGRKWINLTGFVYPQGLSNPIGSGWNAGAGTLGIYPGVGINDVGFINALTDTMQVA